MTFRRLLGAISAIACVLVGLLRALALLSSTEAATGFLLSGSPAQHYLLLAAPLVLALLASLAIPAKTCHPFGTAAGLPAFCGLLFSGVMGIGLFVLGRAGIPELVAAGLMALGCLWFSARMLRGNDLSPVCGVFAILGWLVVCVMLFTGKTASLQHFTHVLELLCSTGILLFLCGVLRAAYSGGAPGISRMVFFRGMLAFYLGVCLLLPQELWLMQQGQNVLFLQGKCVAAALLGLSGLFWALRCMCTCGEDACEEPGTDPAAAAAFEEAERRLREEGAAAQTAYAPGGTDAAAAPQPQRWSSAASALYGTAAQKTAEPFSAPAAAPVTPAAAPAAPQEITSLFDQPSEPEPEPAAAAVPAASPQAAPVSPAEPAAPVQSEEKPAQSFAVAAPPARPAAAPASAAPQPSASGTMARLDSLLENIDSAPKNDSIDALLADLDKLTAKKPAEPAADATAGEKWVFRRD